jgi:hypothetical protein
MNEEPHVYASNAEPVLGPSARGLYERRVTRKIIVGTDGSGIMRYILRSTLYVRRV